MEDGDPRPARAPAQRRVSRFDDFDEEFLAPREQAEFDRNAAGPRRNRASRRNDDELTRRQWLFGSTFGRCVLAASTLTVVAVLGVSGWAARAFVRSNPLFLVASSDKVQVDGNREVSANDVRAVFGEDIGRNLFFIPIGQRQKQMQALPWVEHASVERLLPNQIRVRVTERVPIAFAQDADRVMLVDRHGVLLTPPAGPDAPHYSFPVLDGVGEDVPQSTRQARLGQYLAFLKDVDSHGEQVSSQLSEVDVSDPEDIQAVVADGAGALTLHLGDEQYYERYRMYQVHLAEWQQQMLNLGKVDLRNAPQVVLGKAEPPMETAAAPTAVATAVASKPVPAASTVPMPMPKTVASAAVPQPAPVALQKTVPAKTSAAKPLVVAKAQEPVPAPTDSHVFAHTVKVAGKKPASPARSKATSAKLLRASATRKSKPVKLQKTLAVKTSQPATRADLSALNHPAAPKPAPTPAMQAFMTEAPRPPSAGPRMVSRVHLPAPVSSPPAAQTPAPAATPRLVMHPGFNGAGGQP